MAPRTTGNPHQGSSGAASASRCPQPKPWPHHIALVGVLAIVINHATKGSAILNKWNEQEIDRLREIVSLIDSLENRLQKVKTSLQDNEFSITDSERKRQQRMIGSGMRDSEARMDMKLFLIGIQLELTECPNQISNIQSKILQLNTLNSY